MMLPGKSLTVAYAASAVWILCLVAPTPALATPDLNALKSNLRAEDPIERRRAARAILALGERAREEILQLTRSSDVVIKRAALRQIHDLLSADALPVFRKALRDTDPLVRSVAVEELLAMRPRTEDVLAALREATQDEDNGVRQIAATAFWTFHRDVTPLRKRPDWDHAIEVIANVSLPNTGWKFHTDPSADGHVAKWFDPDLDESDWIDMETGVFWHDAQPEKVGHYMGIGWYRTTVTFPAKPEGTINQVVLRFEAVDESTWLWINGQYAGVHDIGPSGWRTTFDIDITPFVKWGQPNQIAVRVLNTAGAGGIYKPVHLQVLR